MRVSCAKIASNLVSITNSINFKDAKRPAYIFRHLEHQSTVPYDMTLRVIQYKLKILEQARKFDPDADLPVIISLVIYNGKIPWTAPTDFYQLFGEQETLAREAFFNGYQLIDLSKIPDDELANHRKASLIQWVLKHVHDRNFMLAKLDLIRFIRTYFATLSTITTQDEDHLLSISYYLLSAANIDPNQQADFFATICDNLPKPIGDKVMSLAQHIEQQGVQKGLEKGILQGKLEGKIEGQTELLAMLLESKFGHAAQSYFNNLKQGNQAQLLHWARKAANAHDLSEIFTDENES